LQRAKAIATEKATPEQLWAMLAHAVDYDPHACLQHPMHGRKV
jgi:transposase